MTKLPKVGKGMEHMKFQNKSEKNIESTKLKG